MAVYTAKDLKRELNAHIRNACQRGLEPDVTVPFHETLKAWSADMSRRLPAVLLYPLEHSYTRGNFNIKALQGADRLVADLFTNHGLQIQHEVFLSHLAEQDADKSDPVYGNWDFLHVEGEYYFKRFEFGSQEILERETPSMQAHSSSHGGGMSMEVEGAALDVLSGAAIAISPTKMCFHDLARRPDVHCRSIMLYFLHRASYHNSIPFFRDFDDYCRSNGIARSDLPIEILERLLLLDVRLDEAPRFNRHARYGAGRFRPEFFAEIRQEIIKSSSLSILDESIREGFINLLSQAVPRTIPEAVRGLSAPDDHDDIDAFVIGIIFEILQRAADDAIDHTAQESEIIIELCVVLQHRSDVDKELQKIFRHHAYNARFCLSLVISILKKSETGALTVAKAKHWYDIFEGEVSAISIAEVTGPEGHHNPSIIGSNRHTTCRTSESFRARMQPDTLSYIAARLVAEEWHSASSRFFERFFCDNASYGDPKDIFLNFWLPFFASIFEWRKIPIKDCQNPTIDLLRDTCWHAVSMFLDRYVEPEPRKHSFIRLPMDRCRCQCCRTMNKFLSNSQQRQAMFPILDRAVTSKTDANAPFSIRKSSMNHIMPQLNHPSRDCSFHIKTSRCTGRLLLLVKKNDSISEWEKWHSRMLEALRALIIFGRPKLRNLLGDDYEEQLTEILACLRRGRIFSGFDVEETAAGVVRVECRDCGGDSSGLAGS